MVYLPLTFPSACDVLQFRSTTRLCYQYAALAPSFPPSKISRHCGNIFAVSIPKMLIYQGEMRSPKLTGLSVAVAEVSGRNDIRGQELLMAQRPKKTPAFDFLHAIV